MKRSLNFDLDTLEGLITGLCFESKALSRTRDVPHCLDSLGADASGSRMQGLHACFCFYKSHYNTISNRFWFAYSLALIGNNIWGYGIKVVLIILIDT